MTKKCLEKIYKKIGKKFKKILEKNLQKNWKKIYKKIRSMTKKCLESQTRAGTHRHIQSGHGILRSTTRTRSLFARLAID